MIARERMSVRLACSIVDVSTAGYYAAVSRPLVARSVRHAWLTDLAPLVRTLFNRAMRIDVINC